MPRPAKGPRLYLVPARRDAAGRITRADAQTVQVTPEQGGKKAGAAVDAEPARLNYTSITGAKVQVEFTRGDDADAVGEDV